ATGQTYTAVTSTVSLSGTASDNTVSVVWANDRGGSGAAAGTNNWSIDGIELQAGANAITVRARDAGGNEAVSSIIVNYAPDRPKVSTALNAGGSANASTPGTSGTLQPGYAITTLSAGNAPYGTAVFSVSQNGVVVSEAGVAASSPTTAVRIFVEYASK